MLKDNQARKFVWLDGDLEIEEGDVKEAEVQVKAHQARSKKGKIFNVKQHIRKGREFDPDELEDTEDESPKLLEPIFNQKKWHRKLNRGEKNVLDDYTTDGHEDLNYFLRHGHPPSEGAGGWMDEPPDPKDFDLKDPDDRRDYNLEKKEYDQDVRSYRREVIKTAAKLDGSIDKAFPVKESVFVYRGLGSRKFVDHIVSLKKGQVFQDRGFVSTSLNRRTARDFSRGADIKIRIPKGSKAAYIGMFSDEYEVLLPRGARFRIVGKKKSGSRITLEADYIGSAKSKLREALEEAVTMKRTKRDRFVWDDGDIVVEESENVKEAEVPVKAHTRTDPKTGRIEKVRAFSKTVDDTTDDFDNAAGRVRLLPKNELAVIKKYTDITGGDGEETYSQQINRELREEKVSRKMSSDIKDFDSAIDKFPVGESTVVYRGMYSEKEVTKNIIKNKIFGDKAFISTSRNSETAQDYSIDYGNMLGSEKEFDFVLFKIKLSKGFKALPVEKISEGEVETEVILKRNTSFSVKKVSSMIRDAYDKKIKYTVFEVDAV